MNIISFERAKQYADRINARDVQFRLVIAFGNPVRVAVDARLQTPPQTEYPERLGKHPNRGFAVFGPHRIAYVNEIITFFGGRSYIRRRGAAVGHEWRIFRDGVDVTEDPAHCFVMTELDFNFTYRNTPQPSILHVQFLQTGIYEVELGIAAYSPDPPHRTGILHRGRRQVIVLPHDRPLDYDIVSVDAINGSVDGGGWTMNVTIAGDIANFASLTQLEGFIPVVLRADVTANVNVDGTMTGVPVRASPIYSPQQQMFDEPEIIFCGYVDQQTIAFHPNQRTVSFSCRTADMILEQMQTHVVGFFRHVNNGVGVTFNDLMLGDVFGYMLLEKSTFADHHDVILHYTAGAVPEGQYYTESWRDRPEAYGAYRIENDTPNMEYRDWTFNQGQYWSNIRDGARNEFCVAFFTNRNALWVLPDRNYWHPQMFFDHSKVNEWTGTTYNGARYERFGLSLVHDTTPLPVGDIPVATISDGYVPGVFGYAPYEAWPFYPTHIAQSIVISIKTAVPSYYKIVASLSNWNEEWGADYPQHATDAERGRWLIAGPWALDQGRYWSDQSRERAWRNLWRFARNGYAAARARTSVQATFGLHTFFRLCDLVVVAPPSGAEAFFPSAAEIASQPGKSWYEVVGVTYRINVEQMTWETTYDLREATIYQAAQLPLEIPPTPEMPANDQ